ncbi:MAG: DUF5522 domain-containing protein [Bacteroidota bacterium]
MAQQLQEGRDFYLDDNGLMVLTAYFLRERGYCCGNGCRHCPYPKVETDNSTTSPPTDSREDSFR